MDKIRRGVRVKIHRSDKPELVGKKGVALGEPDHYMVQVALDKGGQAFVHYTEITIIG